MVISGRRLSPQEQFLEEIEDDEARTIVRRCLIPTSRFQMSAEIGKGIHCPKHFFPASRMYIFVALLVYVRRVMAFTVGSYICWGTRARHFGKGCFHPPPFARLMVAIVFTARLSVFSSYGWRKSLNSLRTSKTTRLRLSYAQAKPMVLSGFPVHKPSVTGSSIMGTRRR